MRGLRRQGILAVQSHTRALSPVKISGMEDAFLSRFDDHIARMDEHLREQRALLQQIRAEHELDRKQAAEAEERYRSEVQITREVIRRNEVAFQQGSRLNAELIESVRDLARETRADLRELGAEIRAQTEAIFRVLDRWDNGGRAAGA